MLNYYVDPGNGFVFVQNTSFLWGIILGLIGALFFFFRLFFKFFKKFIWTFLILLVILFIGGLIMQKPADRNKVIVLGIDAMDPKITEQLISEGRLPNLSNLKTKGTYHRLTTTIPAESVVAWTSFSTGLSPGSHGIFDFIMRDPKNYLPYLSLNEVSTMQGKIRTQIRSKGLTLWDILSKNKVPSYIFFCPNTFPAQPLLGKMVSGMGVPDISGTMGRFSFYTTKAVTKEDQDSRGNIIHLKSKNNIIETRIYGPRVFSGNSVTKSAIPLRIILSPGKESISLEFQENNLLLKKNNWSNWQEIDFKIGTFRKAHGVLRFYLKSINPDLELYASPINFDPQKPLFPISFPYNYSKKLAKKIGIYFTQGMPQDTWALTENRLDEKAFLEQVNEVLNEKTRILEEGLKDFKAGLFFFYFDTLDIIQHMFWRYLDPQHPLYEKDSLYQDTIFKYYESIDQIIGKVLKDLDQNTTLIIISDHGFNSFRRAVHLNRWLLENGYLFLKEGVNESKEFFEDVDWSKTKAYALGFGGIYLNKIGREYYGIVTESEAENLKQTIIKGLKQFQDTKTGEMVVGNIYTKERVFNGPYINDAPDLYVGFNAGFRASWQTALGGVPNLVIEDNKRKWSGDHLIDSVLVPGVIFVNKKIDLQNPSIIDISPTVLGLFKINKAQDMKGKILFEDQNK
jgi:predicted AlkP superfamily phosphohydrolase/phosphomutase